jgi:MoaA/NifB/PqqE/SkfB family radical SAM enzyme
VWRGKSVRTEQQISMALALGRSVMGWHFGGHPRPVSVSFAVTNRCNLRCTYCNTPFLDPTDLPLEKVELLLDRVASLGVKRLGLAGGEPLARKDIGEIVAMAKARGLYVTMNTNLTLHERRRDAVREVDFFFTSLDGGRKSHEAARGAGSFDGVIEAIGDIVAGGRQVAAICVVTGHSVDEADGLLDLASRVGFSVHFQSQCLDTEIVRGSASPDLGNERLRALFLQLLAWKRAGRPVASSESYLAEMAGWEDFSRSAIYDGAVRCAAGWGFFYIDPAGLAYPCAYTKGKTTPVDFLGDNWRAALGAPTPCTRCSVGPYVEFNALYRRPVRTSLSLLRSYG